MGSGESQPAKDDDEELDDSFEKNPKNPVVTFTVVGFDPDFPAAEGTITAEILLDRVPITASNFIDLCKTQFYDGLHFHRVIKGFMNQFGCPHATDPMDAACGTGGPPDGTFDNLATGAEETRFNGGNIKDEHISADTNCVGSLSMANTGAPNTGGSQFFMNVSDNEALDWFSDGPDHHVVFGQITGGYDVCLAISKVPTVDERPKQAVRMRSAVVSNLPAA